MNLYDYLTLWQSNIVAFISYVNDNLMFYFGITCALTVLLGLLILSRKPQYATNKYQATNAATDHEISAIAGDDVIATQLDLAKAYIEMNQKSLAKPILTRVIKDGDSAQKKTARQLIDSL